MTGSMTGDSEITLREEASAERPPSELVLKWVWPSYRLERLRRARIVIGRDEAASISLQGKGVSRQHAELYRQGPVYAIHDLRSTNGTWLDGRPVDHAIVGSGSVLRIGDWVGVFVEQAGEDVAFHELTPSIFGGAELARVVSPLKEAATSTVPVLLIGDTGTGKELFARAVHHHSGRQGPFLAVNCAALPEQLAEGELFGYRRGAFTGAERASLGHFRAAHGGTLFLDEMPELSPALQAKLLRVLEDGAVQSLGDSATTNVDVRIVSASQYPLADLVAQKRVRRDLAARLTGLELCIPALVSRRADVAPLFAQFMWQQSGGHPPAVEARVVEALSLYDWPQNVRELELVTKTLLAVHGREPALRRAHLAPHIAALCHEKPIAQSGSAQGRREYDLQRIQLELTRNGGSVTAAAQVLGLSRQRIYRLLERSQQAAQNQTGDEEGRPRDGRN